jgi:nicotinamide mononucleotide (NMN) deamidase PncC
VHGLVYSLRVSGRTMSVAETLPSGVCASTVTTHASWW